jgi:hypothetical protein
LRKLIPNAIEMVYDSYNALLVGFCPGLRPSEAIISIAVMPEWVSLCFLQGAGLPDPEKRLEGCGNAARHIKMKKAAVTLDEPAVKALIAEALVGAKVPVPAGHRSGSSSRSPSRQSSGHAAPALQNLKRSGKADRKKTR